MQEAANKYLLFQKGKCSVRKICHFKTLGIATQWGEGNSLYTETVFQKKIHRNTCIHYSERHTELFYLTTHTCNI